MTAKYKQSQNKCWYSIVGRDCEPLPTLLDNCDLANAPVNILIGNKLHDVKEFYYDDDIAEYIMVLTEGYEYEKR